MTMNRPATFNCGQDTVASPRAKIHGPPSAFGCYCSVFGYGYDLQVSVSPQPQIYAKRPLI
jgi:hypothetical protein